MQILPYLITILACLTPGGIVDRSIAEEVKPLAEGVDHISFSPVNAIESFQQLPCRLDTAFFDQSEAAIEEEDPDTSEKSPEFPRRNFELLGFQRSLPFCRSIAERISTRALPVASVLRC